LQQLNDNDPLFVEPDLHDSLLLIDYSSSKSVKLCESTRSKSVDRKSQVLANQTKTSKKKLLLKTIIGGQLSRNPIIVPIYTSNDCQ